MFFDGPVKTTGWCKLYTADCGLSNRPSNKGFNEFLEKP